MCNTYGQTVDRRVLHFAKNVTAMKSWIRLLPTDNAGSCLECGLWSLPKH